MTQPTGNTRKLVYPLTYSQKLGATTLDENVSLLSLEGWTTDDPDERIDIILNVSLNEYVALATCVDVGRDIAYGDNSDYLWWLWSRAIVSVDLCQSIIDCVNNNQDLRELIQSLAVGNSTEGIYPDALETSLFDEGGNCNLDVLWGYCSALVDYIDQQNVDFLQQMAESLNVGNGLIELLSLIPGFELLPFDEIQDFIESFGDYNLEAYQASMTTGVRDQIKCDIFCIAQQSDCSLDFNDVFEYFVGNMGGVDAPTALSIMAEWTYFFIVGSYPSDRIVYIWSAFQLFLVGSGNKFLGLDTYKPYVAKTLSGDPDNDWELLCDECVEYWESTIDLTLCNIPFDIVDGACSLGVGLIPTDQTGNDNRLLAYLELDECTVIEIAWVASITIPSNPDGNNTANFLLRNNGANQSGSIILNYPSDTPIGTTDLTRTKSDFTNTVDEISLYLRPDNNGIQGDGVISQIYLKGTGTKPSQLP